MGGPLTLGGMSIHAGPRLGPTFSFFAATKSQHTERAPRIRDNVDPPLMGVVMFACHTETVTSSGPGKTSSACRAYTPTGYTRKGWRP